MKLLHVFVLLVLASSSWSQECGYRFYSTGLTIRGVATVRKQWPFLVALMNQNDNSFFCGGSIITEKVVLTGMAELTL